MDVEQTPLYLCRSKARVLALAPSGDIPSFKFGLALDANAGPGIRASR